LSQSGWRAFKGGFDRRRRELRRRLLEPLLVRRRTLRDTVMRALAARGHLILCDLGGQRLFVDPSDRAIGDAVIWRGAYQCDEFNRVLGLLITAGRLPPKKVFLELGANIGTHTVYAMQSGHFARAVVFEPEPHNARLLTMNIDINALADRVIVVEKAAGAAPGRAVMHLHPRNKGAHAIGFMPTSPAYIVMKAANEFKDKTIAPNQLWQTDFTYLKVIGWGWFYLSTVLDDFSRYIIIAWKLCATMKAQDVTDTLGLALAASGCDQARIVHKPRLLSDNGSSYVSANLADWLDAQNIGHVRGAPYHPQTQGKIERWHQTLKNRILLENYYLPGDLEASIGRFVDHYNHRRYHESLSNLTPADVYFGRGQTILLERERIKLNTIQNRRLQHQKKAA
jgi:FkbM family methyltransferase